MNYWFIKFCMRLSPFKIAINKCLFWNGFDHASWHSKRQIFVMGSDNSLFQNISCCNRFLTLGITSINFLCLNMLLQFFEWFVIFKKFFILSFFHLCLNPNSWASHLICIHDRIMIFKFQLSLRWLIRWDSSISWY